MAYVSLEYADFVSPSTHTLSYRSEGKTLLSTTFLSTDKQTVSAFVPEREGHEFLGWQDVQSNAYQSGTVVGAEDLVLTATWRELPPPIAEDVEEEITDTLTSEEDGDFESVPEGTPESLPPSALVPQAPDFTLAARIAGVIVCLLAAAWVGAWIRLKGKKT